MGAWLGREVECWVDIVRFCDTLVLKVQYTALGSFGWRVVDALSCALSNSSQWLAIAAVLFSQQEK